MEAKFIAASQAGCELLGLKELFGELDMKVNEPMPIWINKQAAIKQLESEKSTSSAKHVDIRFKFICEYAQAKVVKPNFVKSGDIIADLLTKALPAPRIVDLHVMFKIITIQDDVEEECKKLLFLTNNKVLQFKCKNRYRKVSTSPDWLICDRLICGTKRDGRHVTE